MLRLGLTLRRAAGPRVAAATVAAGAGLLAAVSGASPADAAHMSENRPLGNRHRVGITAWALRDPRAQPGLDETAKSLRSYESMLRWIKNAGYDCAELTVDDFRAAVTWGTPHASPREIVRNVQQAVRATGLPVCGGLYHISDGTFDPGLPQQLDFEMPDFWQRMEEKVPLEKEIGAEYLTFQICLPEHHMNTGGAYRNDEQYLTLCAQRIARLQQICFKNGLNFYVETHIDRLSEDPEAFCKIFDRAPFFEVNADISHYNYRGITKGPHLARINERVNHCHQRMARQHGDLSSDLNVHFSTVGKIGDAEADWAAKGVTWQAMESMKPGFQGGMSSRVVVGESGPAFSVKDALELDAKLVPLYRHMAEYADAQIGNSTGTANPFR